MSNVETKKRSEAPLAALVLGAVALIAGFIATTPGIPLIAGTIAVIAGVVDIGLARRDERPQNWMAIAGIVAAVVGIFVSIITTSA
jgi:uncharacterized membrane protein HdeD (DUF308 family)